LRFDQIATEFDPGDRRIGRVKFFEIMVLEKIVFYSNSSQESEIDWSADIFGFDWSSLADKERLRALSNHKARVISVDDPIRSLEKAITFVALV
jgi:hypothetical protein